MRKLREAIRSLAKRLSRRLRHRTQDDALDEDTWERNEITYGEPKPRSEA